MNSSRLSKSTAMTLYDLGKYVYGKCVVLWWTLKTWKKPWTSTHALSIIFYRFLSPTKRFGCKICWLNGRGVVLWWCGKMLEVQKLCRCVALLCQCRWRMMCIWSTFRSALLQDANSINSMFLSALPVTASHAMHGSSKQDHCLRCHMGQQCRPNNTDNFTKQMLLRFSIPEGKSCWVRIELFWDSHRWAPGHIPQSAMIKSDYVTPLFSIPPIICPSGT